MRQELKDFAASQEEILQDNDGKHGWNHLRNSDLLTMLKNEVEELEEALMNRDNYDIRHECCDIGNYAMMLFDNNK